MKKTTSSTDVQTSLTRARELAWTGQHAQVIDLATEALARRTPSSSRTRSSGLAPAEQMALLGLRAESHIALGQLDRAAQDAEAMMTLAKSVGATQASPLHAQALNCLALVQMRHGELEAATQTATAALKAARAAGVGATHASPLRAESLLRLAEAQTRQRIDEKALSTTIRNA